MRALKWAAGILAGLVALAAIGIFALTSAIDAGTLTPRITAAIEAATGRAATLGAVALKPGLTPRVEVQGATLANLPGGSRPEMARIRRLEVTIALLPLLRGDVEIAAIAIDGADILLERSADGRPNWILRPAPREAAAGPSPVPAASEAPSGSPPRQVSIAEVTLTDSQVRLPDERIGTVIVPQARILGFGTGRPVQVTARIGVLGLDAAFAAEARQGPDGFGPVQARLSLGANTLGAEGTPGQDLRVTAALPEPDALRPLIALLVPGLPAARGLPPLEAGLTLDPALHPRDLEARLGATDLADILPGLALTRARLRVPALDQPAELQVEATRSGLAMTASLRIDNAAALLADRPVAVTAEAEAARASLHAEGRIERPLSRVGATASLRLAIPDLAALAAIVPDPAPLTDLEVQATLAAPGPLDQEVRIGGLRVASPLLTATGDLVVHPGEPLGVSGRIAAARVDVDALAGRLAARPAPAPSPSEAAPPPAAPGAQPVPAPAPPPAAARERRVIPDIALPVAAVRAYRGQLEVAAETLVLGGAEWHRLRGTLAMAEGVARLTDASAVTPGGPVRGEAALDAARSPPVTSLDLRSEGEGLDLAALRLARREAAGIEGRAQVRIQAQGRGATTRALAASLTGEAGLALVNGRLAHAGMLRLGRDLMRLLLPGGAPTQGVDLRCLALRITAEDGLARTDALLAETSAGRVEGAAAVNLRTEGIAARLLPDVTLLGLRVRAPIGIGGTLADPRVGVEPARALVQVIGDTVANRLWRNATMDWLRGEVTGSSPAGDCEAQLRLARFGAEGPAPPPEQTLPVVPRELQGTTQDLLRGLGGLLGGGRR